MRANHYEVAELLIRKQANISHADSDGWSAIHHAALKSSVRVMKMLLYAGANRAQLNKVRMSL